MIRELYLLGVGPGDPELIALKSARILAEVDVVAFPIKPGTSSLAFEIAKSQISNKATLLPIDLPMKKARKPARDANLAPQSLAAITSVDIKSGEIGLHHAAAHFGVPLQFFSSEELARKGSIVPNPSEIVKAETSTPSVAEAAALFGGDLLVEKQKPKTRPAQSHKPYIPSKPMIWGGKGSFCHNV